MFGRGDPVYSGAAASPKQSGSGEILRREKFEIFLDIILSNIFGVLFNF